MRNLRSSQMLAIVFALLAAIGFAFLMISAQPETVEIVIPTHSIPAYEPIDTKTDFTVVKVRKSNAKALDKNVTTVAWLNDFIKKNKKGVLFSTVALNKDTPSIDNRALRNKVDGTLALVNRVTERAVAVALDPIGSGAGSIHAGDVVTVVPGDTTGVDSAGINNVKVIAIGPAANIAVGLSGGSEDGGADAAGGNLAALLAVPADQAVSIVGQTVSLVLNPFCEIDKDGNIIASKREGVTGADCGIGADGGASSDTAAGDSADTTGDTTDTTAADSAAK